MAKSKSRKKQPVVAKDGRYVLRKPMDSVIVYPVGYEGEAPGIAYNVTVAEFLGARSFPQ